MLKSLCFAAEDLPATKKATSAESVVLTEYQNSIPTTPPKSVTPSPSPTSATPTKSPLPEQNGTSPEPRKASTPEPKTPEPASENSHINNAKVNNNKHVEELYDIPVGEYWKLIVINWIDMKCFAYNSFWVVCFVFIVLLPRLTLKFLNS